MRTFALAASLLVLLTVVLGAVPAAAETENCTPITSVPVVIGVEGVHCLTAPIATTIGAGRAIDIQANNVVLDLNGFKLGNLGAGPSTQAIGIGSDGAQNIHIKNGTIRGFHAGIEVLNLGGATNAARVERIRAEQNRFVGRVHGQGNVVRENPVVLTGGSTNTPSAHGIWVEGLGSRVVDNDVHGTSAGTGGSAAGITIALGSGIAERNRITDALAGISFVFASPSNAVGKYRDNTTLTWASRTSTGPTRAGTIDWMGGCEAHPPKPPGWLGAPGGPGAPLEL